MMQDHLYHRHRLGQLDLGDQLRPGYLVGLADLSNQWDLVGRLHQLDLEYLEDLVGQLDRLLPLDRLGLPHPLHL